MTTPRTVGEVEQLVKRFYQQGNQNDKHEIDDQLRQLQLSQDGWQLADQLMASDDRTVRYFAALTFTVKLNLDGSAWLDSEKAQMVLLRLIYWLVRQAHENGDSALGKKLCSTLTVYFIRTPRPWLRPLLHLALSFHQGKPVSNDDVEVSGATMAALVQSLNTPQLQVLLWFASSLAEEVGKVDANLPVHARCHQDMERIVEDASILMNWTLTNVHPTRTSIVKTEALRTFLSWINYAQPVWPNNPEALQHLRNLIDQAAQCILVDELQSEALFVFRDILEGYTTFFQPSHVEMMARMINEHVRPELQRALSEQDPEAVPLGQLIIAFGCANIEKVVGEPGDAYASKLIIQLHLDILGAPGHPGDDDELSIQSIEFWNTYIEYVNDVLFSLGPDEPQPAWMLLAKNVMQQTVELIWKKMWTPPSEVTKDWGETESEGFKEFRLDASDLILSTYLFLGKQMLQQLVSHTLQSLRNDHWRAVEAAMLCLNALADNVIEDLQEGDSIGELFRSSLFRDVADFSRPMPAQTRRTAIDLLGSYGPYIEQHAEFLPDAIRLLFASLEHGTLANTAAKSIGSLCSACRTNLTSELDGFLMQYQRFLAAPTADSYTKDKVIGAIAAIVQALSPERAKARPLLALIENIEKDVQAAIQYASSGDQESAEVMGVTALECLASIGKGMQLPEDVPISIYSDDEERPDEPSYWDSEEGQMVKQRIVGCFAVLQAVGNSSSAIDAACQVLRSGYTETEPGPFVLPPSVTVSFLQQCDIRTPQLEAVLSVACTLVTQHSRAQSKRIETDVASIYGCVVGLVQTLGQPMNDPTVAKCCIDITTQMIPYYIHILLGEHVATVLDFVIRAIAGAETFPKRSAIDFWTKMIRPKTARMSQEVEQRLDNVMAAYGVQFTVALIHQIGGRAQRSDLDLLCEPLKALLLHQSSTQIWIQGGLTDAAFPGTSVSLEGRERFMRQLLASRNDGRRVKDLVKAFWASCRGTVASYGS